LGGALRSSEDGLKPGWIKGEIIFARVLKGAPVEKITAIDHPEAVMEYTSDIVVDN
jgi:hypothetical protein